VLDFDAGSADATPAPARGLLLDLEPVLAGIIGVFRAWTAAMEWHGGYDLDGYKNERGRFILGQHELSIRYYAYPSATLTDQMFRPTTQNGWGAQLPEFVREQYKAPPGSKFPPTDIGVCH
jgi:hypothetical protein